MNLADLLHTSARRHGQRPAVTDTSTGRALRYADLARDAERVATTLAARGVARGHRIGLVAPNEPAHLAAAFGLLASGACLVPIAPGLRSAEIDQIMSGIDLNGCLWSPATRAIGAAGRESATIEAGECAGYRFDWIDRDRSGPPGFADLDAAFIRFTSGTTAASKGVVLSHRATLARVESSDAVLRFGPDDRIAWVLPLAYHFAVTIVAYVRAGAHVLLCPDALPGPIVAAIDRHRATVLYASPLHLERLAALAPRARVVSLRLALSTSAPISRSAIARFEAGSGIPLGQAYGIIEAGLPCINRGGEGLAATSVGRPVPGYEVAAFSDAGERVAGEATGEIGLRGAGLFSAYYAPWTPRAAIERGGWFMTGDIGRFDADGALHLEGRKKSVIFVGGLKFFPEEVEECLNQFPGVEESRVFARPHPRLGDVPCAEIVSAAPVDLEALRAHCARRLSPWKAPAEIERVSALPKTAGGKILRWRADDAGVPAAARREAR